MVKVVLRSINVISLTFATTHVLVTALTFSYFVKTFHNHLKI